MTVEALQSSVRLEEVEEGAGEGILGGQTHSLQFFFVIRIVEQLERPTAIGSEEDVRCICMTCWKIGQITSLEHDIAVCIVIDEIYLSEF